MEERLRPLLQPLNGKQQADLVPLEGLRQNLRMRCMTYLDTLKWLKTNYRIQGSEQMLTRALSGRALLSLEAEAALMILTGLDDPSQFVTPAYSPENEAALMRAHGLEAGNDA